MPFAFFQKIAKRSVTSQLTRVFLKVGSKQETGISRQTYKQYGEYLVLVCCKKGKDYNEIN